MKVVLAGAFGKLGSDILRALVAEGHEVTAADMVIRELEGLDPTSYQTKEIDVTNPENLSGLCDGAEVVITTVGLTGASTKVNNYDIDYQGNLNLVNEAKTAGVQHFVYISVINADKGDGIPMVNSKYMLEEELKKSGMTYVIHRPTGYFYDIAHVFWPMIKKGQVQLLKGEPKKANVIDTMDFAKFIVATMTEENTMYNVGGTETYTYQEIAQMFWEADGREGEVNIKYAPAWMFSLLAILPKIKKEGKSDIMRFSKFTLSNDCYGDHEVEGLSFKQYIAEKSYAQKIEDELAAKAAAANAPTPAPAAEVVEVAEETVEEAAEAKEEE